MNYPSKDKADTPKNKGARHNKNKHKQNNKREFKPPKKISEKYLYNSGLAYLQRFPASSAHFKTVMMRKVDRSGRHHIDQDREQCEKWLDALILKFQELAMLDDTAYLKGMVTSLRRRGMASRQIEMRLTQKGLQKSDIIKEIKNYDRDEFDDCEDGGPSGDFHAAIIYARKKRLGPYDINQRKTPEKAMASLARAGYSYDIAKKVITLTLKDIEKFTR